jgi:hypothetical protein
MRRQHHSWFRRLDQPDPYDGSYDLTDPQSFNRYSYVGNDPVNLLDPTGLMLNSIVLPGQLLNDAGLTLPVLMHKLGEARIGNLLST